MDRGSRKRADRQDDLPHVQAAKEEVLPGYEEYLVLLQERNRLLKKMRKKNKDQIEIERKEQGFSVYVNGPHKGAQHQHHQQPTGKQATIPTNPNTARLPKTAGDAPRNPNILDNKALQEITRNEIEKQKEAARARTAPSARERRRNWNVESVDIKTTQGERKVKAPEILSGRYVDDFEADEDSDEVRSSDSENSEEEVSYSKRRKSKQHKAPVPRESDMFNSSDSVNSEDELHQRMSRVLEEDDEDLEIDASKFSKQSNSSPRKQQKTYRKGRQPTNSDEEEGGEKLMLSMRELKHLRHSLAKNATIRESLARHESSGEEDFVPEACIPEVEEDLPTDDSASFDESPRRHIDLKKPDDQIVIEFGGAPVSSKKVERNLSAARRKDLDEGEYSSGINRQRPSSEKSSRDPPKQVNRSQSAKMLIASEKKTPRPLSANRRTPDRSSADTDYEASAVMAALREENEKAVKYNKDDNRGVPKVKPSPKAARDSLVKPLYDNSEMPPRSHQMRRSESPTNSVRRSPGQPLVSREKIEQIMEKVLKMNPKQQRKLVKMLGGIEQSLMDENKEVHEEKQLTPRRSVNKPVKATRNSLIKNSMAGVSSTDPNILEVYVEIKSNWGHPMRLGLTEIQLYDVGNTPIAIKPSDVSVFGAEETNGTLDLLFNGKFKTNKERNMWSCRYHARRPVEFTIIARNPSPGKTEKFALGMMKIWNFNKSINDLDVGVKDVRIFVGSDLVFNGPVEKGCGNQVFDYCHVISLKPETSSREPSRDLEAESKQSASKHVQKQSVQTSKSSKETVQTSKSSKETVQSSKSSKETVRTSKVSKETAVSNNRKQPLKDQRKEPPSKTINNGAHIETATKTNDKVRSIRPPVSPRNERSPSPAPKRGMDGASPRAGKSTNHRSISPSPRQGEKKTFRSISMSSQSSASSGGDSRPNSAVVTSNEKDKQIRSETKILNYPKVQKHSQLMQGSSDSLSDDEDLTPRDGPTQGSSPARRRGSKTPKKSKRMAARLDGHTSSDIDNSRSITDSIENRPPVPQRRSEEKIATPRRSEENMPPRKSQEKTTRKALVQKSLEDKANKSDAVRESKKPTKAPAPVVEEKRAEPDSELDDSLRVPGNATSSSVSVTSSQDDMPMLQKLKDMNKKEQVTPRKKEVPRWLKQEDVQAPFENPPESRGGKREEKIEEETRVELPPPSQDEINMLIDEELSLFPDAKKAKEKQEEELRAESNTPMQRIQKNRSKWRENPSMNLEESWGSLSQFNKNQRGRISLDMDDDVLDEYINKAAKLAGLPVEPTIPEEGQTEELPTDMSVESDDDGFVIPELPYGKELVINIRTTWGDKHYVGLTGLEVFSSTGELMAISKIVADPSDINVLPDYKKDPRVVKNLADGINRTRDDIHMWLAPFNSGRDHLVFATLEKPCKIALLRIWNYNKSRIHSYRGAKDVVISLDSSVIFKGEIARACGGIEGGTEAFGDTILFTMDEAILDAVSQNDEAYEGEMLSDDEPFDVERPSTAEGVGSDRPFTRAVGNINEMQREATNISLAPEYEGDILVYKGNCIELNFTATWGDQHYLGLTGIELVGKDGEALPVTMDTVSASPSDVRALPGHERDDRTLDKLINGNNVTVSDEHMWLIPFTDGNNHTLTINFGQNVLMAGLRIWNYNKSKEDTYRGARIVHVAIDRKVISPPEGYLIRKGPGNCHFDFAQEISFSPDAHKTTPALSALGPSTDESQNYDFVQMPCGFIYQLQLFSTWGDVYYVGLNGLEFYDANLQQIPLSENNISAYPDSVNVLDNVQNDARTPDKLIDGTNDTADGAHTWLAPILPSILNRVYVIFDQPTTISMIKLWNYSKTTNRGTKDFALLVDDLLVYNGVLQPVTTGARGILPTVAGAQPHHTILFTNNRDLIRKEKHNVISNQTGEQDVQMTNDKKIVSHYSDPKKAQSGKPVDQSKRPTTSVIHSKKRR